MAALLELLRTFGQALDLDLLSLKFLLSLFSLPCFSDLAFLCLVLLDVAFCCLGSLRRFHLAPGHGLLSSFGSVAAPAREQQKNLPGSGR